jgi:uncharacterized protein YbjT (DUF2867 family)
MRIAVIGGTGIAGRAAVAEGKRRGHIIRVLARHRPDDGVGRSEFVTADLTTGAGLDDALVGVDVVLDCSNIPSQNEKQATDFFVGGTRRLLAAEEAAHVRRHVVLSIVGIDDLPMGYYRAKVAQERTARAGRTPTTVVRATQFHDFAGQLLARTARGPVAVVPRVPVQPVSTADVADALFDVAEQAQPVELVEVAGPERRDLVDLARRTLRAQGRRAAVIPLPVPGALGRKLRAGALLLPEGRHGSETFDAWLDRQ